MPDPATNDMITALLQDNKANYVSSNDAGPNWWPNQQDVDLSKKYDTLYGSPQAPNATPGAAYMRTAPSNNVMAWYDPKNTLSAPMGTTSALNTENDANRVRAENLASERSAVAKLGWDPGLAVSTPPGPDRLSISGTYKPKSDVYWYDQNYPATGMHEPMHRGIEMLRQKGLINVPKGSTEEAYVRALMQRAYGDVETKNLWPGKTFRKTDPAIQQIESGKKLAQDPAITELERVAAEEVARRHPRGPR